MLPFSVNNRKEVVQCRMRSVHTGKTLDVWRKRRGSPLRDNPASGPFGSVTPVTGLMEGPLDERPFSFSAPSVAGHKKGGSQPKLR